GSLEPAGPDPRDGGDRGGRAAGTSPRRLGRARRVSLGRRQHAHDLRHPRHRSQHRVSDVEREQPAGNRVGCGVLQRAAGRWMAAAPRRSRRSRADVRGRDPACGRVGGALRGGAWTTEGPVMGGPLLRALGAVAVALGSATGAGHRRWQEAAGREGTRYAGDEAYVGAALAGESAGAAPGRRSWLDWMLVGGATATFVGFGIVARVPQLTLGWGWVVGLTAAMLALL